MSESVITPITAATTLGAKNDSIQASSLSGSPATAELRAYLKKVAVLDGLDYDIISNVVQHESGFRVNPPHNGVSWGIAQFTKATWKAYGFNDIMDPYRQLFVMGMMWREGKQSQWDEWCLLYAPKLLACRKRGL